MVLRPVGAALALIFALAAPAAAAPTPDRVLAEVDRPIDIAAAGSVTAWLHHPKAGRDVELVIHDGRHVARRLSAGRVFEDEEGTGAVDVGRDGRGRTVVAYIRCDGDHTCDLRVVRAAGGPPRRLARFSYTSPADVAIGRGRVYWTTADSDIDYAFGSRPLGGGATRNAFGTRSEGFYSLAVGPDAIAALGYRSQDSGLGSNADPIGLNSMAIARGRATTLKHLTTTRDPGDSDVSRIGLGTFEAATLVPSGMAALLYRWGAFTATETMTAVGGRIRRASIGMPVLGWDADGDRAVFVEAATADGCELYVNPTDDTDTIPAPCRIVRTERRGGERLLPARIAVASRVATVSRAVLAGGRVVRRVPQAGVTVTVQGFDRKPLATLKTDAKGQVALPEAKASKPNFLVAATTPPSYAADHGR
jgi:hypothetical protein